MEANIPEIWEYLPITRRYQISNKGRIFDTYRSKLITQYISHGYPTVNIIINDKCKTMHVHRLVIWAFYGELSSQSMHVNHIDCNRANNNLENLELVTPKENILHRIRMDIFQD